jgi:16S rRNA (guanine(966)-N(2))-methyltransferase RsmD
MRIISGNFRGKKITAPSGLPVRPTTDFAKEALFNVLNNRFYFDEISVLDLFSGIGSISLEFISRGSNKVVSVDSEIKCVKFLEETVKKLQVEDKISIHKNDVLQFLKKNHLGEFDVVFADPPFDFEPENYNRIIQLVFENSWLKKEGVFILEHSAGINFDAHPQFRQSRKYGNINFSFFESAQ